MNKRVFYYYILLGLVIVGCSNISLTEQITQHSADIIPSSSPTTANTLTPTVTASPSPTPTARQPTNTLTPTLSPTPSDTPTPTNTLVPWGFTPITVENAQMMIQKGYWGLGSLWKSRTVASMNVVIYRTPFGIYLYYANNLQLIRFLPEAGDFILSPAEDLLFIHLPDGSIQVVSLPTGEERFIFTPIAELSPWMKDYIYAQLPADRPAQEKELFDQISAMRAVDISPDGKLMAIAFGDSSIGLWDSLSGSLVTHLKNVIVADISEIVFSPNGEKLLSSGRDGEIAIWRVEDGKLLWRIPHIGHIVGQPFSPDGRLVALEISQDTSHWVVVRDSLYGDELAPRVVGRLASQAISPDNSLLLTTWYEAVTIWSLPNLVLQAKIETGLAWPDASFSSDDRYILINGGEQAYLVSDLRRDESYPKPISPTELYLNSNSFVQMGHLNDPIGLHYPRPNLAFAWGSASDHEAWVWDLSANIQTIYDFGKQVFSPPDLSFNADRLVACTEEGLVMINLSNRQTSQYGRCREQAVVRFSMDGKLIFLTNGVLLDVLDSNNGVLLYSFRGHSFLIEGLGVTPDGTYLVSSSESQRGQGKEVIWWQLDSPKQVWRWMVSVYPYDSLYTVDFQPQDGILYTAQGGIRSWRLGDGVQDHLYTTRINSLALSRTAHLLATGDFNGDIQIWSLDDWQILKVLTGHKQPINSLTFSPDGTTLLSLSTDGTIRLWGLP